MITAILGFLLGIAAIILGNALEGGHLEALLQPTAALIVFGGTMGATMLSSQVHHFSAAIRAVGKAFFYREADLSGLVQEIVNAATVARKEGILALDNQIAAITNPFFRNHLRFIIDGYDPNVVKEMAEDAMAHEEEEKMAVAKVWETAGGYAPTVGILGAVLGLIHVMSNLSDSSKLGAGIAVAFVATVYGVGGANLVMLPIANRLRGIAKNEMKALELCTMGLMGIQSGLNPRVIEARLRTMMGEHPAEGGGEAEARKAA